jgi:tetratricopeptide (TPR) repeat protein
MRYYLFLVPIAILGINTLFFQANSSADSIFKESYHLKWGQDRRFLSDAIIVVPSSTRPADANDYNVLAEQQRKSGDDYAALASYNKAIQLNSTYADYYNNRGSLKMGQIINDLPGALTDFNMAIRINPRHYYAHRNRGTVNAALKDFKGAVKDYTIVIGIDGWGVYRGETYLWRGRIKANNLNDFSGALEDYNMAISLSSYSHDLGEYYNTRGILKYNNLNDINGALEDYNVAIEKSNYFAYYNRGLLKKDKLKDRSGAIDDFRQAARKFREIGDEKWTKESVSKLRELGAIE